VVTIKVRIQPKSSRDEIVGIEGGRLKIKITAPPVDGKANQKLIEFIAKTLGVSKSSIEIVKGSSSKLKTLAVHGVDQEDFDAVITQLADE